MNEFSTHLVLGNGGGNRRIAADKLDAPGVQVLEARGLQCVEGTQLTEIDPK